jgi:predicted dehydrogenase
MINIAVSGIGSWGKNLVRNFNALPNAKLSVCCDLKKENLEMINTHYPALKTTTDFNDILSNHTIDAVVISTTASAHFELAKKALKADKHVFIEKPMTLKASDSEELIEIAEKKNKKIMVGHLMLFHPAVRTLKEMIEKGELGDIYYIYSQRVNLGTIRNDESALWSFAPHDLSVIFYLLGDKPKTVSVRGESFLQDNIEDVVFLNLHFKNKKMAQMHLSWLDPSKLRRMTIVGSKKMVVFDDVENTEKLKIFDKGVNQVDYDSYGDYITLRFGDINIPRIDMTEPLKIECQHFLDCIMKDERPLSDGYNGLQVVRVLEAAQKSLEQGGTPVNLI